VILLLHLDGLESEAIGILKFNGTVLLGVTGGVADAALDPVFEAGVLLNVTFRGENSAAGFGAVVGSPTQEIVLVREHAEGANVGGVGRFGEAVLGGVGVDDERGNRVEVPKKRGIVGGTNVGARVALKGIATLVGEVKLAFGDAMVGGFGWGPLMGWV
jgi:hypothetical protein